MMNNPDKDTRNIVHKTQNDVKEIKKPKDNKKQETQNDVLDPTNERCNMYNFSVNIISLLKRIQYILQASTSNE